jgi:hypothetical protein
MARATLKTSHLQLLDDQTLKVILLFLMMAKSLIFHLELSQKWLNIIKRYLDTCPSVDLEDINTNQGRGQTFLMLSEEKMKMSLMEVMSFLAVIGFKIIPKEVVEARKMC